MVGVPDVRDDRDPQGAGQTEEGQVGLGRQERRALDVDPVQAPLRAPQGIAPEARAALSSIAVDDVEIDQLSQLVAQTGDSSRRAPEARIERVHRHEQQPRAAHRLDPSAMLAASASTDAASSTLGIHPVDRMRVDVGDLAAHIVRSRRSGR